MHDFVTWDPNEKPDRDIVWFAQIKPRDIAIPRSSPDYLAFFIAFINLENAFANIEDSPAVNKEEPR